MPKRTKILVVEDDEATAYRREQVLTKAGFTVTASRTMTQGLTAFQNGRFDIALIDIRLPDGNGYEMCRQLRRLAPDVPVVLISAAYPDDAARTAATFAGGAEFVAEPVAPEALVATLRRHL